jgi:TetR/AcrR family transcriptional repressor of nem operon
MKSKGETTRNRILAVTQELINTKGFGATSINDIVEATGIQKGGIYFHFDGKDSLALAVLEEAHSEFREFLTQALEGDTPRARLESFFRSALDKHLATGFVGGCIFGNSALEMSDRDARFAKTIERVFDEWVAMLKDVVVAAQKAGEIRTDFSANDLAVQIVATIEGGIMLSRLKKNEEPMRQCLEILRRVLMPN